jgi:hypothetical protein
MNSTAQDEFRIDPEALMPNGADTSGWGVPDMSVLQLRRRPLPRFPIEVFRDEWAEWITNAAKAAACPIDYVALPLLASASTLIGNARWAQASRGWKEPPHLWMVVVGDSGEGKSPGADCMMGYVAPEIERRMIGDFSNRLEDWKTAVKLDKLAERKWEEEVRAAQKDGKPVPKYGGMEVSDARKLRALEDETRELKKLLARRCSTWRRCARGSG